MLYYKIMYFILLVNYLLFLFLIFKKFNIFEFKTFII